MGDLIDENGNPIALVINGPSDGDVWFCREMENGDIFVPMRTSNQRPMYVFNKFHPNGPRYVFAGFEFPEMKENTR